MVEPLSVDTDGVRSLSDIHTRVATGLGALTSAAPGSAGVAASHGTVAHAVQTALTAALGSRSGTMATTQSSGSRISELLARAAAAYEQGDQRGAAAIKAAADAIGAGEAADASTGPAGVRGVTAPSGGGSDAIGQVVGQLGQLGQMGQQLGAPLTALGQPLQQLPQQVMQGIQQTGQTEAAGEAGTADAHRPEPGGADPGEGAASGAEPGAGTARVQPRHDAATDHSRPAD